MDVRSRVFDLITRDVVLRAVRVIHTDCGQRGHAGPMSGFGTCSLVLEWACPDQAGAPAGSQLLTVWAHLPRERSSDRLFIDVLLQRARAVLMTGPADGSITSEYRGMSREVVASNFDTISASNRFQVTPRQPRREGMTLHRLAPWEGTDRDSARFGAFSGAAQTLN